MVKITFASFLAFTAVAVMAAPVTTIEKQNVASPTIKAASVETTETQDAVKTSQANKFSTDVKYSGKATWFTHEYGACNINWNSETEPVVALNAHQMGSESWNNPACNRRVKVTNQSNGKTVVARIVDKCPGNECVWGSLDLSPAAFKKLGLLATGVLNIEWHYV
ncbi:hypothetical protein BGZ76_000853 [Entomortierella beljakovae]|nr:hypothetical protein BGZ76_000853 [Entomortierella beljakovae]